MEKFKLTGDLVFMADDFYAACDTIIKYFEEVKEGEDSNIALPGTNIRFSPVKEEEIK